MHHFVPIPSHPRARRVRVRRVPAFGDYIDKNVADHCRLMGKGIEDGGFMHMTLCHGDYRLDNIFFDWAEGGGVSKDADGKPKWCARTVCSVAA